MNNYPQNKSGKTKKWKGRYTILLLLWLGWLLSFLDRMVMSVSLPFIGRDLQIDEAAQGMIISAFFAGYALFQIPGGWLADRFGARKVMASAIIWWSIFTSLTGLVFALPLMLLVRFLFGVGEGCFPASSWKTISTYFPSHERGRATAFQSSVNTLGPALAVLVAASIIGKYGWHTVFIVLGIPGIILGIIMYLFCYDSPKENPHISQDELDELEEDRIKYPLKNIDNSQPVPFIKVLSQPVLWKLSAVWFLFDITFWGFTTWIPSYLMNVRNFTLAQTGLMAAIPFLFGTVGTLFGGYVSDKYIKHRKLLYALASVVSAIFLYFTFTVEDAHSAVVYQCVSAMFMFFAFALFWGMLMDFIPQNIMGRASSIVNFGGQVAGVVSPIIIGVMIQTSGSYNSAFMFMVGALIASAVLAAMIKNMSVN